MKRFISTFFAVLVLSFSVQAFAATSIMFTDQGAAQMLAVYFNNSFPVNKNLTLKLFCNNVTPSDTDTTSTYTECTGGGYTAATLTNGSWVVSQSAGIEQAAYALQSFAFTGALTTNPTVYGYYVIDAAGTPNVIYSQALNSPFTPVNNGDTLKITPQFMLSHGVPSN
jgi:hypothetical protein